MNSHRNLATLLTRPAATFGLLGSLAALVACSVAPTSADGGESVGSDSASILSTACVVDGSGNLALSIADGEVAYIGKQAGCTTEPCVFANAQSAGGTLCRINSTGKTITVTRAGSAGAEKLVLDYTNGLFAAATTTTPLVSVTLDAGSKLAVMPPVAGGNMALGVNGLDINALSARNTPRIDVTMTGFTSFEFDGNAGPDVFTGDPAGWTTAPKGWATAAALTAVLGAATASTLTVSGGAGDDILAGGAAAIANNLVNGGPGNDTFLEGVIAHASAMDGGDGIDTADYSMRTVDLTVSLDATANDGASGENDNVGDSVEIIKGGSGNDQLSAAATLLTDVVLIGNAGNDKLTGGGGNDDLCGGVGDDTLVDNLGNDMLVGSTGADVADYSAGTGNKVCLRSADATCAAQNGATGELDVINNVATKHVCPRATLNIDVGGTPAVVTVPTTMQGGAMAVDVENITGNPTSANILHCGTLPCTLFGGTGDDTLWGYTAADTIFGLGGDDTVATNGGADLVDLTHAGSANTPTIDCHSDNVTVLLETGDTASQTACSNAVIP